MKDPEDEEEEEEEEEEPEPDLNAVSASERDEMAWRQKEELDR